MHAAGARQNRVLKGSVTDSSRGVRIRLYTQLLLDKGGRGVDRHSSMSHE